MYCNLFFFPSCDIGKEQPVIHHLEFLGILIDHAAMHSFDTAFATRNEIGFVPIRSNRLHTTSHKKEDD